MLRSGGEGMYLFYCGKGLIQIRNDIINMLSADRQPDGVGLNAHIQQFFLRQLRMRGSCRMDHQRLYIRHVGQQREDLQMVDKFKGLLLATLDLKGENGCAAIGEILLIQGMVGMIRQGRMVDMLHLRMIDQILHDLLGVLRMALQPQGQSLRALQQQECGKGGDGRTGIPQKNCADIGCECSRACGLRKLHAVIAGIRLRDPGIPAGLRPVKGAAIYNHAAQGGTVAANELGCRMDHHISPMLNGTDQIGRAEGIVDDQRQAMLMCNGCDGIDIRNIRIGIAQGFNVDSLGVVLNGIPYLGKIMGIYKCGLNAIEGQCMSQQIGGTAVNSLLSNDMLTGLGQCSMR